MKNLIFGIVTITTLLLSCSPDNPNPNGNGSQTYTQGTPVTDIDGNTYPTIISDCGQTWTAKNLSVSRYRNGDVIPQVTDPTQWSNLTTGAWCYCENNSSNGIIYGKLYNWYAVNDPRGLAPAGWHIPSTAEWTNLTDCLGNYSIAGGKMKEVGLTHWLSPNTGATNSSGFTGLPGGYRDYNSGEFREFGVTSTWLIPGSAVGNANYRYLSFDDDEVSNGVGTQNIGCSIRCVKD